ncbi:MAG: D-alanine--D-alanine ligase [Vicinamibacteria bacterium]|nr:D-alanine--D-alanine ligase [Vicinamibacteria bacterium]
MKKPRPLRVLVLVQKDLIPPEEATPDEVAGAPWKMEYSIVKTLRALGHTPIPLEVESNLGVIREAIDVSRPQIAFNCLESFDNVATWDANVVGYLEMLKLPYTGCNSRGLLLGRDKSLAKTLLSYHRIPVPRFLIVSRGRKAKRPQRLTFPLFVKSLTLDASIGISQASVVETDAQLVDRVAFIHESIGTDALVEQYVEGRELYVGILGNRRIEALPVWELSFDKMPEESRNIATERLKWSLAYQKKHGIDSGPAVLEPEAAKAIQELCKRAFRILMMSGCARVDLRITAQGRAYVIEANPNPQLSPDEDFAQSSLAAGIKYPALIQRLLSLGLRFDTTRAERRA